MATKKQITQVMKSAINEAASYPLNMKPPTLEDMYEHALGVTLGEATKAQMRKGLLEAQARRDDFFKQLENIEPIPIQIAKAIQATQSGNNKPSTVGSLSQDDFAKACGVTKRQVQRWEKRDSTPPTLYDETTKKMVTYSAEMRNDPVKAQVFAANYKTHKRIKKGVKGATQYEQGITDAQVIRDAEDEPASPWGNL